jgi:hypothetical protein
MPRQNALPPSLAPRLIGRDAAAAYVCVSPNTFDDMVERKVMPPARILGDRRRAWDVRELDAAADALPHDASPPPVMRGGHDATQSPAERRTQPVKNKVYLSFRLGKGPRIRLPDDPSSQEFREAYAAAMAVATATKPKQDPANSIGAPIASYIASGAFKALGDISKAGYMSRLETMRVEHGHRAVAGLTRERIQTFILDPLADRPGAGLDTLKKLRILIRFAMGLKPPWLSSDPSIGIKRPKGKEIRSWTDAELAAYERRWPIGTKHRTAYALMLNMGTARIDTHLITWNQVDQVASYERHKTGVAVEMALSEELRKALAAMPRTL